MRYPQPDEFTPRRSWSRLNVVTVVLSIFILLSTLLSAFTLGAVWRVRDIVRAQLQAAAVNVGELRQQTIRYEFPLKQSFPISTSIQVDETFQVPIRIVVPIREQVTVPVGPVNFPVDLNIDVPISTTVPVQIRRELPIHTNVDLDTTIPLEVNLRESPVSQVLQDLEEALRELLGQL